jgi:hypothetical protein
MRGDSIAWLILPVPRNAIFSKMLEVDTVDEKALARIVFRRFARRQAVAEMIMITAKKVEEARRKCGVREVPSR